MSSQEQKKKDHLLYQVLVFAPDRRFPQPPIKGGLDKRSAIHEAKRYKELGMFVQIFDPIKKQFIKF